MGMMHYCCIRKLGTEGSVLTNQQCVLTQVTKQVTLYVHTYVSPYVCMRSRDAVGGSSK